VNKRGRKGPAFSLVELLVAIATIGLLAAIAIPAVSRIFERGRTAKCIENLRQLHLAMNLHLADSNGRLPLAYNDRSYLGLVPNWGPTWAEYLTAKFLGGNKAILHCASRPSTWTNAAGYYPDYAYNSQLGDVHIARIPTPSKTVLFTDSAIFNGQNPVGGFYAISEATGVHFRHPGKTAEVIYLDGHLDPVPMTKALPPATEGPLGFKAFYFYLQ